MQVRNLRLRNSEADARAEQALADKEGQMSIAEELRGEVQEKINLIEEFEDKFTRQFRREGPLLHFRHLNCICYGYLFAFSVLLS